MATIKTTIKHKARGKVHLSMNASSDRETVTLKIEDEESGSTVMLTELTHEQIVRMLAGRDVYEHTCEWDRPDRIGWQKVNDVKVIEWELFDEPECRAKAKEMEAELIEELGALEVSVFWKDLCNPHRRSGNKIRVRYWAWYPPSEGYEVGE